jgi:hypothetical protein
LLGAAVGQRPQPRAGPAGEDQSLHKLKGIQSWS